jgi:predicted HAD superfamily Cof-like phosphohydrolase
MIFFRTGFRKLWCGKDNQNQSMQNAQKQIREFMVKAQQETPDRPTMPDRAVRELRLKLISEELAELAEAFGYYLYNEDDYNEDDSKGVGAPHLALMPCGHTPNTVEAYDAILDLLVVVIGTAVAMGLQVAPGWEEVHKSNMSKFIDGHRRADGKWEKGPSYSPANLRPIIVAQTAHAENAARQLLLETSGAV